MHRRAFLAAGVAAATIAPLRNAAAAGRLLRGQRGSVSAGEISASRTTGIVPFTVFFELPDLVSTAVTAGDEYRDITCEWLFGETAGYGVAAHSYGAQLTTRNAAKGHKAAHLFTIAGAYTVQVTVTDPNGSTQIKTIGITARSATAPVEWDDTRTILVSTGGGAEFTCAGLQGTPTQVTFSTWASLVTTVQGVMDTAGTYKGAARVLFRAGQSFEGVTVNGGQYFRSTFGPGILSNYDDTGPYNGAKATITSSAGSASGGLINIGGTSATYAPMEEWKITNLILDCSATPLTANVQAISTLGSCDALCIHNVDFVGVNNVCIQLGKNIIKSTATTTTHKMWDEFSVTSCTQTGWRSGGTQAQQLNIALFASFRRGFISDNAFDAYGNNAGTSHVMRLEYVGGGGLTQNLSACAIVSHNKLNHPGTGRHAFKCHSDEVISRTNNTAYLSTSHGGNGDYRRPADPVGSGYCLADTQPPVFRCTTSGTSGGSEPVFDTTPGNTTADGTCVWTCVAYADIAPIWDKTWDTTINPRDGLKWGYRSHDVILADNEVLGSSSAVPIAIGPLDNDDYSRVENFVVEGNFVSGDDVGSEMQACMWIMAGKHGVVRNNAANFSQGVNNPHFVFCGLRLYTTPGTETSCWAPDDVQFDGNSGYIDATVSSIIDMFRIDAYARNLAIKNNLLYTPGLGSKTITVVQGTGHATYPAVASNNTGNVGAPTTDPVFTGPMSSFAGFKITNAGSYTKDAGATTRNRRDAFGVARPQGAAHDIGLSEQ